MKEINGKPFFVRQIAFEARYNMGFEFLDRSGSVINSILRENVDWSLQGINPGGADLFNLNDGTKLSVSSSRFAFSLSKPLEAEPLKDKDISIFIQHANALSPIFVSEFRLDIEFFKRIGSRIFFYVPFESEEEANDWILNSSLMSFGKSDIFPGKLNLPSFRIRWLSEGINYSLNFDIFERSAQLDLGDNILGIKVSQLPNNQKEIIRQQRKTKRRMLITPEFFVNIDFDFYVENDQINQSHLENLPQICFEESMIKILQLFKKGE